MSIFDRIQQGGQPDLRQIQQDPIGMAKQAGYNIPPEQSKIGRAVQQE